MANRTFGETIRAYRHGFHELEVGEVWVWVRISEHKYGWLVETVPFGTLTFKRLAISHVCWWEGGDFIKHALKGMLEDKPTFKPLSLLFDDNGKFIREEK